MATLRFSCAYFVALLKDPRTGWLVMLLLTVLIYHAVNLGPRAEERAVSQRYEQWWSHLKDGNYERAYAMMSPDYRSTHSQDQFYRSFLKAGEEWLRPHSGKKVASYQNRATIFPRDSFAEGNGGPEYELRRIDGKWYFTGTFEYRYGRRDQLFASR